MVISAAKVPQKPHHSVDKLITIGLDPPNLQSSIISPCWLTAENFGAKLPTAAAVVIELALAQASIVEATLELLDEGICILEDKAGMVIADELELIFELEEGGLLLEEEIGLLDDE